MSDSFKNYKNQNYNDLKANCLKSKRLFEDPLFPANDSSLFRFNNTVPGITWKRPSEFISDKTPEFIVGNIAPEDIDQGQLGDWYLFFYFMDLFYEFLIKVLYKMINLFQAIIFYNYTSTKSKQYKGLFCISMHSVPQ